VALAKGSIATNSIAVLVKGTMKMMTWLKLKLAIGVGVTALLAGGVAAVALSDGDSVAASSGLQMRLVLDAPSRNSDAMVLLTTNQRSGTVFRETLHVQKKVQLDRSALAAASVSTNALGDREIDFVLTETGKRKFARVTRENIGRRLAIVVDGRVINAPVIRMEISAGRGQINGIFTEEEAKDLVAKISPPAVR